MSSYKFLHLPLERFFIIKFNWNCRRELLIQFKSGFREILSGISYKNYDFSKATGVCENLSGIIEIPLGIAGPVLINGVRYQIPMATAEGCLVASTNRAFTALVNGIDAYTFSNGVACGPVVRLPNAKRAADLINWLQIPSNFNHLKHSFDETSDFVRLILIDAVLSARSVYLRFVGRTGDSMGINIISKVQHSLWFQV